MFHKKGTIVVPKSSAKEDDLMNIVLENGGEDLNDDGDNWEVLTPPNSYEAVLEGVKNAKMEVVHSAIGMVPQNYIKLEGPAASQMIRLLEAIEDQDDVQNVYSNFDVDQKQLEEVAS
jgi:transcriptional/translational regulatory protein YebC/TACO1